MSERKDIELIAELVPEGARVLDLGCGDGELLALLQRERGCSGYGIEIDDANVLACHRRGINVIQLNLEEGLALFDDASFDVVLQLDTLQHLKNTEKMLRETARVGRIGIVSFPNFAHWPNRLHVIGGRMPVTRVLPYQWYDTPNIRVGTYADFEVLARKDGLRILDAFGIQAGRSYAPGRTCSPASRCSSSSAAEAGQSASLRSRGESQHAQIDIDAGCSRGESRGDDWLVAGDGPRG